MPLDPKQTIISADDHMDVHVLPPDLFQERLPAKWRERGPQVRETDDGPFWFVDGNRSSPSGRKGTGYISADDHGFRPGDPKTRLEDMDRDGIYCHVVYGPTTTQLRFQDPELHAVCSIAYNDWAAEFNKVDPNRLVLLPDLPSTSPQAAVDELQRVAGLGHRGAIISNHVGRGDPIFEASWLPFWDAAQDVGLPIHVHLSGGNHSLRAQLGSWRMPAFVAVVPMQLDETLAGMIFSGVLEQRPNLKFVMGEAGLGWIPYVIERLDHELHKYGPQIKDYKLQTLPSEIFARQIYTTYEDEKLGVELIPRIGVDNVMWASDYPHGDSTWPHSRKAIDESPISTLGEEAVRKITCENAARLYGIEY